MRTDVYQLTKNTASLGFILDEAEKAAAFGELNNKQAIRLRLLAEELIGMLPELLEYCKAELWIENEGKKYELHVSVTLEDILSADREKLMEISTSGKNAAATGIMGKIRAAAETMIVDYLTLPAGAYCDYYTMVCSQNPIITLMPGL